MSTYCSVDGCRNTVGSPGVSFFRCPKDVERCQIWKNALDFIGTHRYADIIPEQSYNRIEICSLHFSADSFSNECKTRLHNHAVPSLLIPTKNARKEKPDLNPCATASNHQTMGTSMMRPEEVSSLSPQSEMIEDAMLDIEYSLPDYGSQNSLCVTAKVTEVLVDRVDGSLGITLRGGLIPEHPGLSRPLVITQVRKNGPAHRTGLVRVGDRLLKVDQHSLVNKTLLEAQQILKDATLGGRVTATLTVEYDVSVMESVRYANGPLLLEIERQCDEDFGLVLASCSEQEEGDILGGGGVYVEQVIGGSTADRCGALCIGDRLLAIDDAPLPSPCSAVEAQRLLRRATRLQILPAHAAAALRSSTRTTTPQHQGIYGSSKSPVGFGTWNSKRSQNIRNRINRQSSVNKSFDTDFGSNWGGFSSSVAGVSHPEILTVTLNFERGHGYGIAVAVSDHTENRTADIIISWIAPESPAYRCGCLQIGDRILAVNHQPNLTLQEINSLLELGDEQNGGKITLQVEFDVADSVVPTSGVFTVKLAKRGPGLGITITASKIRPDEPFLISSLQRGSTAHRTGTLRPGDRLLAVDDRSLDRLRCSPEAAFDVLQRAAAGDVVSLTVEKLGGVSTAVREEPRDERVEYTVELRRRDGPLGVTISGSEDSREPIVLSRLTEGGLAEKTGALHVGDKILAINGESLEHRPLSDAIRLLQTSGDRVQLKIARNLKPSDGNLIEPRCSYSSPGLMSVDSAVDSWDSNTLDNANDNSTGEPKDDEEAESVLSSEALSYQDPDKDFHLSKKPSSRDSQLQYYSDTAEDTIHYPSPLPLPCYTFGQARAAPMGRHQPPIAAYDSTESVVGWENEIYHVTLYKDSIYDDYGFSVSDGLYEKGVYVNRIRKGGPADIVGLLKPYDRIIQVNDVKTQDFDCCLTVPLIASAGDRIELVIARNPYLNFSEKDLQDNVSKKSFSPSQNTIIKTL